MTSDAAWSNPVKARLGRGEPVFGVTITTPSLDLAARAATLGFDFLWVEMEHAPITLETLRHIVLATRGLPAVPFARVPVNELWTAKRALDAGVHGVIFPFTSRPELARQAVSACRYPPRGRRGSGAGLATASWPDPDRYCESADENVVVVAIIEDVTALDHLDGIASTPGIDVLFIGTSDLAFSLGHRGQQDQPDVQAAIDRILQAALRHGKAAGRPARSPEQVQAALAQGFQLFQLSSDLQLFGRGARQLLEPLGRHATHPVSSY
ncbi:MAG: aldolase [Luteitalea sp.]|nr:aldolase [Luteitalea sp.]